MSNSLISLNVNPASLQNFQESFLALLTGHDHLAAVPAVQAVKESFRIGESRLSHPPSISTFYLITVRPLFVNLIRGG